MNAKKGAKPEEPARLIFEPGATVIHNLTKQEGTLLRTAKKGSWVVQFGTMKMTVKEKDVSLVKSAGEKLTAQVSYQIISDDTQKDNHIQYDMFAGNKPLFELKLLGLRSDEALKILERQLDLLVFL